MNALLCDKRIANFQTFFISLQEHGNIFVVFTNTLYLLFWSGRSMNSSDNGDSIWMIHDCSDLLPLRLCWYDGKIAFIFTENSYTPHWFVQCDYLTSSTHLGIIWHIACQHLAHNCNHWLYSRVGMQYPIQVEFRCASSYMELFGTVMGRA